MVRRRGWGVAPPGTPASDVHYSAHHVHHLPFIMFFKSFFFF